jgi:hypothetical protein
MIPDNFDTFGGGYIADDEPGTVPAREPVGPITPTIQARLQAGVALSQERIAHYLGEMVEQAEAGARAERQQERRERAEQQHQMMEAVRTLAAATHAMAESNAHLREQTEALHAEMRTLRSAILLAHSIGGEAGGSSPSGLDVAMGTSEPFVIPQQPSYSSSSSSGRSSSTNAAPGKASKPVKTKRTRNLSPEARERISAAQKARWAAQRARNE